MGAGCGVYGAQLSWVDVRSSIRKEWDPDLLSPSFRNLTCDLATGGHHGALAGYRVVVGGHGPEVTVDGAFEGQRTDRRVEADQGLDLLRCGCVGLDESLERRLGAVMKTSQMVTALELPNLVHDWLKAVVEGPKQLGVQVVEPGQLVGAVEAAVADQPPDQISVLLFDVGVVVLGERAARAELDLLAPAVAEQGLVEELGTIVNVDSQQRKGQLVAHAPEAGKDFALALSKDRDEFGPASLQVGRRERVDPVPSEPGPTVPNKVHLDKARPTLLLPVAHRHRDLALDPGRGAQAVAAPIRCAR